MRTELPELPAPRSHRLTETAQRFLASAYDSVDSMLEWFDSAQDLAAEDATMDAELGAWTRNAADNMLRALLVFAGAGLDASTKQLIRDALPEIVKTNELAREKFLDHVQKQLDAATPAASRALARYLTAEDPRGALVAEYVEHLTGSSLQSVNQVDLAVGALGLTEPELRRRIKTLAPMFVARNEVVHELDLLDPQRHGDLERRTRTSEKMVGHAYMALCIGQEIINSVAAALGEGP